MIQPQSPQRAMTFLCEHSYGQIQELVEELTPEQAGTFWTLIEDKWRGVALRSGRGGRANMQWTRLLRKMTLFERKAKGPIY